MGIPAIKLASVLGGTYRVSRPNMVATAVVACAVLTVHNPPTAPDNSATSPTAKTSRIRGAQHLIDDGLPV